MSDGRWPRDLAPLDPCYGLTHRANRSAVHVKHPGGHPGTSCDRLTLCGRTIDTGQQPAATEPIGCRDCRQLLAAIRDREAHGKPAYCLYPYRPWGYRRNAGMVLCKQPADDTHRVYSDDAGPVGKWHDGVPDPREGLIEDDG